MKEYYLDTDKRLEERETLVIKHLDVSGVVALDVGANKGTFTEYLWLRFNKVYAIEPNIKMIPFIRTSPNVTVLNFAAWDKNEIRSYNDYHSSSEIFSDAALNQHYKNHSEFTSIDVFCLRLDLIDFGKVDYIKIDVEGAEINALEGCRGILEESKPELLIEVHSNKYLQQLLKILDSVKYKHEIIGSVNDSAWNRFWITAK